MRPPMASDHVVEEKKRILYIKKWAPYNSGEERVVSESIARRLCVLGVAIPAPKRDDLTKVDETGKVVPAEDTLGGWGLSANEEAARDQLDRARKEQAGDYKGEVADQEARRREEELRVQEQEEAKRKAQEAKAEPKKKPQGFLKGQKGDED